jgi:hypothetical protein
LGIIFIIIHNPTFPCKYSEFARQVDAGSLAMTGGGTYSNLRADYGLFQHYFLATRYVSQTGASGKNAPQIQSHQKVGDRFLL